jgi:uncharacterized protein involved in exopolysaccharide biosynthesis
MSPAAPQIPGDFSIGAERLARTQVPPEAEPIPAVAFVNAILRNRARIASLAMLAALLIGTWKLTRPRTYRSSASFMVEVPDQRSAASGLAAQFGLTLPIGQPGDQSPAFYTELLHARPILEQAAAHTYTVHTTAGVRDTTLASVFNVKETDSLRRRAKTVSRLDRAIGTNRSRETGVVTLAVEAARPELAQQIVARLLELITEFNLKTRQSRAANERRFVEKTLGEKRSDLQRAESALSEFLQRNRGASVNAPELSMERDRLNREIMLRQQLYNSLAQSLEQVRIDEIRDIPALTVLSPPTTPVDPEPRGTVLATLMAVAVVIFIGSSLAAAAVLIDRRPHTAEHELNEFDRLWRATTGDLRRPWRFIGWRSRSAA